MTYRRTRLLSADSSSVTIGDQLEMSNNAKIAFVIVPRLECVPQRNGSQCADAPKDIMKLIRVAIVAIVAIATVFLALYMLERPSPPANVTSMPVLDVPAGEARSSARVVPVPTVSTQFQELPPSDAVGRSPPPKATSSNSN